MPLILAIEPDQRQASQLVSLARNPLGAEIVVADTAEDGLRALGARVPDVILTSALLSPKDEAALADRLRELDASAAHVQTLTIPVLAAPARRQRRADGGVLNRFRRGKNKPAAPEGCDPRLFAEQIAAYLERAAAERAVAAPVEVEQPAEAPVVDAAIDEPVVSVVAEDARPAEPLIVAAPEVRIGFVAPEPEEEPIAIAAAAEDVVEPAPVVEEPAVEPVAANAVGTAPVAFVDTPSADAEMWSWAVAPAEEEEAAPEEQAFSLEWSEVDLTTALTELTTEDASPARPAAAPAGKPAPAFDTAALSELEAAAPRVEAAEPEPEATPPVLEVKVPDTTKVRQTEDQLRKWRGALEELRQEVERLRVERRRPAVKAQPRSAPEPEPEQPSAPPIEAPPPETPPRASADSRETRVSPPSPTPPKKRKKQKAPAPVQDEWGFFDPEQCGFAALLAKLDELTDGDDPPPHRERPHRRA